MSPSVDGESARFSTEIQKFAASRDSGRVGCICPRRHDYLVETKENGYRVDQ